MKQEQYYELSNEERIPKLGFGTWLAEDGDEATNAVKEALKVGYNHIDTAMAYDNEDSVGNAIASSGIPREDIYITSKLANSVRGYEETVKAVFESLSKLQTKYLDLFLVHWPNPLKYRENWREALSESWRALEDLYEDGILRSIGVSNFEPHHIDALMETSAIEPMINQIRISPGDEPEEIIEYCKEKNILLQAYSPLGHGRLFANQELKDLANKYNKKPSQLAIRWSLQKGYLPLPKSVTPARIKENLDVFDFEISPEDMEIISKTESSFDGPVRPDETNF